MPSKSSAVLPTPPRDRFLKRPEVTAITGLSKTTIYERIRQGVLPQRIPTGNRNVVWSENQIMAWIEQKKAEAQAA